MDPDRPRVTADSAYELEISPDLVRSCCELIVEVLGRDVGQAGRGTASAAA